MPQVFLVTEIALVFYADFEFCIFLMTFVFVTFNKVSLSGISSSGSIRYDGLCLASVLLLTQSVTKHTYETPRGAIIGMHVSVLHLVSHCAATCCSWIPARFRKVATRRGDGVGCCTGAVALPRLPLGV